MISHKNLCTITIHQNSIHFPENEKICKTFFDIISFFSGFWTREIFIEPPAVQTKQQNTFGDFDIVKITFCGERREQR